MEVRTTDVIEVVERGNGDGGASERFHAIGDLEVIGGVLIRRHLQLRARIGDSPSCLRLNGLSVHGLDFLRCGLHLREDDGVPAIVTEVLNPLDIQLRERGAAPLTSLEDDGAYRNALQAHALIESKQLPLRIVQLERNHLTCDFILNLICDEHGKLRVFTEAHLADFKLCELDMLLRRLLSPALCHEPLDGACSDHVLDE